jgi:hypothetical protein
MDQLDLRTQWKHLYNPSAKPVAVVDGPGVRVLLLDGALEPGAEPAASAPFQAATQALPSVWYALKFAARHHEIHLGDPRRTQPGRLRTVLRQLVEPAA